MNQDNILLLQNVIAQHLSTHSSNCGDACLLETKKASCKGRQTSSCCRYNPHTYSDARSGLTCKRRVYMDVGIVGDIKRMTFFFFLLLVSERVL